MRSLRAQLGAVFLGFLLLVSGSVAATFLGIRAEADDALVINLAGRQRMLVQQITKEALLIEKGEPRVAALEEAIHDFDITAEALIHGGRVPFLPDRAVDLPATRDPAILPALQQVLRDWSTLRESLSVIMAEAPGSSAFDAALRSVEAAAPGLVGQTDEAVRLFEAASAQKVARLQFIQAAFFASALALLGAGAITTQRLVVGPLLELARVADRIGHGDLSTPVRVHGSQETRALSQSLESMRAQLLASQEALRAWAGVLEARVAQRTRELVALYEVSREISSHLDIHTVLRSVTDKARQLLNGDIAALCLLDPTGLALTLQSVSGPDGGISTTRVAAQMPPAEEVLARDHALTCGVEGCPGACTILAPDFQVSHIAAPLRVGERVIGALCVGSRTPGVFPEESARLLTKLANSVAIALENARLYAQAERVAMLEERQRIAADMHDGLAQTLSGLNLTAEQAAELVAGGRNGEAIGVLGRLREVTGQASLDVRRAIASLQDGPPLGRAFHARLVEMVEELGVNGGPAIDLAPPVELPADLPPDESEQLLRVIREALLNACHHASAMHISIRWEARNGRAAVTVEDDGQGFDPRAPLPDGGSHFGLSIMRARAARLGGQLAIDSAPGQGTRVTLTWPLERRSGADAG